jgi:hypothetical protein
MEQLKGMNEDAHKYLNKFDPNRWSRAWFNKYSKCGLFINNICECFNSYTLKARDKLILTMLKRDVIEKLTSKLCLKIAAKLDAMECIITHNDLLTPPATSVSFIILAILIYVMLYSSTC